MKITLNNDQEHDVSMCGVVNNILMIILPLTFAEAYPIFSDPESTKRIVYSANEENAEYTGYTEIVAIHPSTIGGVVVALKRGDANG